MFTVKLQIKSAISEHKPGASTRVLNQKDRIKLYRSHETVLDVNPHVRPASQALALLQLPSGSKP